MNRNDWIVHRFDNNPALEIVPNTTIADLNQMVEGHDWVGFDLITASPPCLDFSNAYSAPRPTAPKGRAGVYAGYDLRGNCSFHN